MDEDLIPYYKCVKCGGNVCKDGYSKRLESRKVICLECDGY